MKGERTGGEKSKEKGANFASTQQPATIFNYLKVK